MKNNLPVLSLRCLALGLFLPFVSVAQSAYGIQAGLNLSDATVQGPTPFVSSPQGNYFLGLQAHHPLNVHWAISSDAQYTKRGFFLNQVKSATENRLGIQLAYVDLATKMEYTVFKNIGLQLGAYTGFRLDEHIQLVGSNQWEKSTIPQTDQWDLGLQVGVVARFQRWSAFARYNHGVKTVARQEITDQVEVVKLYNRGLQMGASYDLFN